MHKKTRNNQIKHGRINLKKERQKYTYQSIKHSRFRISVNFRIHRVVIQILINSITSNLVSAVHNFLF